MPDRVWMRPAEGSEPQQVEATADVLVPLMVKGWSQCEPPVIAPSEEVTDAS